MMHYNFARVHQTLRVTPAMEAGLTPQSADSGGVFGNLSESARELMLKRLSWREWACHYGWSKRQAAASGCAVWRMKTLQADFRKGGRKNPLITMTLGAGGFK